MTSRDEVESDEALMVAYRNGDNAAFDALYRRHRAPLFRYLLRQCRNRGAAEELFQDVWMNLVNARRSYTVSARFATYLYRIAHNRLIDHYRRDSPRALVSFDDETSVLEEPAAAHRDEPQAHYELKAQAARLLELVESLPAAQREAFVLQQESGMSIDEIAAATGVGHETAKSRLRYAVSKIREGMSEWR